MRENCMLVVCSGMFCLMFLEADEEKSLRGAIGVFMSPPTPVVLLSMDRFFNSFGGTLKRSKQVCSGILDHEQIQIRRKLLPSTISSLSLQFSSLAGGIGKAETGKQSQKRRLDLEIVATLWSRFCSRKLQLPRTPHATMRTKFAFDRKFVKPLAYTGPSREQIQNLCYLLPANYVRQLFERSF